MHIGTVYLQLQAFHIVVNDLGFEKPTTANTVRQRHHARLWKTDMVTADDRRVFVGTTSQDTGMKWWGLTHKIEPDIDSERGALLNDLLSGKHAINYTKTRSQCATARSSSPPYMRRRTPPNDIPS